MKNIVIKGDYENKPIQLSKDKSTVLLDNIEISSETVEYYIVKYTHFTFNILDIFAFKNNRKSA